MKRVFILQLGGLITKLSVTSPIVLAGETKASFVLRFQHYGNKIQSLKTDIFAINGGGGLTSGVKKMIRNEEE